jgi:hypothetical protein
LVDWAVGLGVLDRFGSGGRRAERGIAQSGRPSGLGTGNSSGSGRSEERWTWVATWRTVLFSLRCCDEEFNNEELQTYSKTIQQKSY